jgi:hypothetical protein
VPGETKLSKKIAEHRRGGSGAAGSMIMLRALACLCLLAAIAALAIACSSGFPRDQYYGTDAGSIFTPGSFDAAIDAPDAPVVDAEPD